MHNTTIKIDGMTCMGCVNSIKNVLQEISGVDNVEVSLEQAQANIQYDADVTNDNVFIEAIKETGFDVAC